MIPDEPYDKYEQYEAIYDSADGRDALRFRRPKPPKRTAGQIVAALADPEDPDELATMTYHPSLHEAGWLLSSLQTFYEQKLITDVLSLVKGGKEATVYCCEAHPTTGLGLIAAKVYRPHKFRTMRNDAVYRLGRDVLSSDGAAVKKNDHRVMRALGKKSDFGLQVAHTSWLMHEYTTLESLHAAGGAVPRPVAAAENAILMAYWGDVAQPAPTLNAVSLEPDEAERLFRKVLHTVELLLAQGQIHGDLSAYNILYWARDVTVIDFPQVVNVETSPHAQDILERDVWRTCEYFARQGVRCDPVAIAADLWQRFCARDPAVIAAELSRRVPDAE